MSGLIVPPEHTPQPVTRPWGGVYKVDRVETAVEPGRTEAEEGAQRRVRESARKAGHRPVGAVALSWHDHDPGNVLDADPEKVWIAAQVQVVPNGETVRLDPAEVAARVRRLDNGR